MPAVILDPAKLAARKAAQAPDLKVKWSGKTLQVLYMGEKTEDDGWMTSTSYGVVGGVSLEPIATVKLCADDLEAMRVSLPGVKVMIVTSAALEEDLRGLGLGKRMYEVALTEAAKKGYAVAPEHCWHANMTSPDAKRVWESLKRRHFSVGDLVWGGPPPGPDPAKLAARYREALKIPPIPGYTTYVRDDSKKNLPTNLDREKEQVLPLPGSATPGGEGRDIPKFETNTPDNGIPERPRTLPEKGEEYGVPYKDDYNHVTRRTMTASEIAVRTVILRMAMETYEGFDKDAFERRWQPGKRQRKQRGQDRQKSRNYYRQNKSQLKRKAKLWRKVNKNKGAFKASNKRRRRQVRKRRGSLQEQPCAACTVRRFLEAADIEPPRVRGGPDGQRQREQVPEEKRDDRNYYRRNKGIRKRQSERWYKTVCRRNTQCKNRHEDWQEDPDYYERGSPRREASLLTVPEIAFGIGPEMVLGYVRSLSPMSGMVTYELHGDDFNALESLPVEVFLRVAAFLSDEDTDAFFELVDAEIGLEAYEDLDEEGLRECAALYEKDPDSDEFKSSCFDLTGDEDISNLSGAQLDQVNDKLVLGVLEGGGEPRDGDDAEDGDETIGDEYDPHLFYGEVEMDKAFGEEEEERVASSVRPGLRKVTDEVFYWSTPRSVKPGFRVPRAQPRDSDLEALFEEVRKEVNPSAPSRLNTIFVCPRPAGFCRPGGRHKYVYEVKATGVAFTTDGGSWTEAVFKPDRARSWAEGYWNPKGDVTINYADETLVDGVVVVQRLVSE